MKTDAKHDALEAEVVATEMAAAEIRRLVDAAEALHGEKVAELAAIEAQLDAGAMNWDLGALVKTRAAVAGECAAAGQALGGRRARLAAAEAAHALAVRDLSRARLADGIKELRAADAALLDELLVGVRAVAAKSVALAARDTELRELLVPADYLGANAPGVPALLMASGLGVQLGEIVSEAFVQERARHLAHHDSSPAAPVAAKETR